jgi:hypothetical protein
MVESRVLVIQSSESYLDSPIPHSLKLCASSSNSSANPYSILNLNYRMKIQAKQKLAGQKCLELKMKTRFIVLKKEETIKNWKILESNLFFSSIPLYLLFP